MEAFSLRGRLCLDRPLQQSDRHGPARIHRNLVDQTSRGTTPSPPVASALVLAPRGGGDGSQRLDLLAAALAKLLARRKLSPAQCDRRCLPAATGWFPFPQAGVVGGDLVFLSRSRITTFYSGVARACNELWRRVARPKGLPFSEPVIRLPAYLAGIASIATIASALARARISRWPGCWRLSFRRFIPGTFATPAKRGPMPSCFACFPLVFLFFLRALKDGRWRWWVGFRALASFS